MPLTFDADILGDRNGFPIEHTTSSGLLNVYSTATITRTVKLQGRAIPKTPGEVKLSDDAGKFTPTSVSFDQTTGIFSATVPIDLLGSTFTVTATHSLYLSNRFAGLTTTAGGI